MAVVESCPPGLRLSAYGAHGAAAPALSEVRPAHAVRVLPTSHLHASSHTRVALRLVLRPEVIDERAIAVEVGCAVRANAPPAKAML